MMWSKVRMPEGDGALYSSQLGMGGRRMLVKGCAACVTATLVVVALVAVKPVLAAVVSHSRAPNLGAKSNKRTLQDTQRDAQNGNAAAESRLGLWYVKGYRVPENRVKALYWFKKAAAQGNPDAENDLGVMYDLGEGVSQNPVKAAFWLKKAAAQGNTYAETALGDLYLHGRGVPQNATQAAYWWKRAAAQGNPTAELNVGDLYLQGQGVPQNAVKAIYWLNRSAAQGNAYAEYGLGSIYFRGAGVPGNTFKALYWWKRAAAQGIAYAEYGLGSMYFGGSGVPRNPVRAIFCFRKAAMQGNAAAETVLGNAYFRGIGVPRNRVKAISWWNKAARQGNVAARFALALYGGGMPHKLPEAPGYPGGVSDRRGPLPHGAAGGSARYSAAIKVMTALARLTKCQTTDCSPVVISHDLKRLLRVLSDGYPALCASQATCEAYLGSIIKNLPKALVKLSAPQTKRGFDAPPKKAASNGDQRAVDK